MLGVISNGKYTIAIAGTHGKTTTTAMVAKIFQEAGKSPTVIVGSLLGEGRSNFVAGESEFFIVEACEYKRSFLNLSPRILVITNIDNDHLDYYGSLDGVQKAFREMCKCVPEDGVIVTDVLNETVKSVLAGLKCRIVDYQQEDISALRLKIPGEHNRNNARAAVAVAREVNITNELACRALETFAGTWRRFEYKGATRNATLIYDDYAHHPTEIQATLGGARELFPDKTITVIFQPHLYSRTKGLVGDFAVAFVGADNLLLAPIYSARESFDPSISSEILAKKVSGVPGIIKAFKDMASLEDFIKEDIENSDVIITMGAGDIYKAGENILVKDKNTKPVTVPR
jgi:UDP-N-acetylmuramate--alanine ligase